MNVNVLAFVFGALLLFVAIVGGGFELRELKVPRVGWAPRVVALVVGVLFIALGFAWTTEPLVLADEPRHPPSAQQDQPSPPAASEPVDFTITDQLGQDQVAERVEVRVDGKTVGALNIDLVHPTASLTVTVPQAGSYSYELRSATYLEYPDGTYDEFHGEGTGQIEVTPSASFAVVYEEAEDGSVRPALE
jgi:hypothetical protein